MNREREDAYKTLGTRRWAGDADGREQALAIG
jgi:hypothetical protein